MLDITFNLVEFEYILLIFVRIASFVFVAPFFSQGGVPAQAKIGLSFLTAAILYTVVPVTDVEYAGVVGYGVVVLKEGITGLLIGFAAYICNSIVVFAGSMIDMDIGLSMAQQFNPDMNIQMTSTGNLYYYMIFAMLLATNMHHYILRAVCDSFYVVPLGGAVFEWDSLVLSMITYMTDLFVIGFRIFLPVFAVIMIMNCVLGVMAKVAPQINMFSVGIQLKVIVGLTVLFLVVFLFPSVSDMVFAEIRKMVVLFIEGMY